MDAGLQSLNMRFWPRRETILRPILWSPEDLQLFDCHFSAIHAFEPQTCEAAGADDSSDHAALAEREALVLQRSSSPLIKGFSMRAILNDGKLYRQQREPSLRIGNRVISPLPFSFFLPVEKQHLARGGLLPMTGYIDYAFIHSGRRKGNHRKLGPGQRDYGYLERLKRITPRAWTEDPYILFILLSMAQSQYLRRHGRHNTTFRASLFVTKHECRQDIYLFDVDISTALLDELDDPRIVPKRPTRLDIHRTRISFEPRQDLWARLVAALSSRGGGDAADGVGRRDGEGRRDVERQGDGADEEGLERQET
ncbi:hypothetical protein BBO_01444 [Beauveria brongniartii RCEF 3172]|uniref:Uncharacterized protein n=1 Tax=Beauveria brongniartii RCEF 3172 TaxID=1081107 RepID=A0A167J5E1_9HYPO|nr:hypothetical protein BBO_01444 [Beauveria brongniartii RCEF 3172]